MEELERCPFCGGEAHWFRDIDGVSIECQDCSFSMGVNYDFDDENITTDSDDQKIADIWNSIDRTKTPKKEDERKI